MIELFFAFIGVLTGTVITYLIFNTKLSAMKLVNEMANQQIAKLPPLEEEKMRLYGKSQADAKQIEVLNDQIKTLREDKANMEGNLKQIMTDVTNDSFIKQSKLLTEQQSSKLSDILDPLKEKIKEFQTKVETNQTESTKTNSVLMEQIKQLTSLNQTVTQKTEDLSNALRGSTKAQGGWGEMILERVLERSGLKKGSEYEIQLSTKNSSGDIIRPDAVIYLPDNKNLIIDSKVSLTAYEQYSSSDDQIVKDAALKSHMASVKGHIKLLSEKDYHSGLGLNTPDFTLMFIPIESGFALSIKEDITLFEYAWDRKIVFVSPSTLLATLRTIASVWKNENQTKNAVEIAQRAGDLYDKFVAFTEDMETVGKSIEKTDEAYHKAMNKLSVGKGNLVNRANQLKSMGINATKNINPKLVEEEPSA